MKTKSEALFEGFLTSNNLPFEKIEEEETRRPDYRVFIGGDELIFEIKQLAEDRNFGVEDPAYPDIRTSSRTTGDHIRRRIRDSKKQIQFGADRGIPSTLLIYNDVDPMQFGTERMDFITAMYGAYTVVLGRESGTVSDWYNGTGQMLQEEVNTSFSAVGHLCDRGGRVTVTLYEKVFAKVKIPYDRLPVCFDVQRVIVEQFDHKK